MTFIFPNDHPDGQIDNRLQRDETEAGWPVRTYAISNDEDLK